MQHKRICLGLFAAFAGLVTAADDSDVTQLTGKTFDDFVKTNDLVLAECKLHQTSLHPSTMATEKLTTPSF